MIQAFKNFINFVFTFGTILGTLGGLAVAIHIVYLVHYGDAVTKFSPGIVNWFVTNSPWWQAALLVTSPLIGCLIVGSILGFLCYMVLETILVKLGELLYG